MPLVRNTAFLLAILSFALASCDARVNPAKALEERLYAPCCWRQSLRDHDSPIATQLRAEIEGRIGEGESQQQVERDLVSRYGEKIRALPPDGDPRWMIGVGAALAAVAGLLLVVRIVRRRGGANADPASSLVLAPDDADRLDEELAFVE